MVPPAPAPDDHADPAWLGRISTILHLTKGGVVVGLEGAHPACVGPLIELLLEGGANVRVCFSAREILEAPEGAHVVLLHAARDAELLNLARPVVAERRLRVFVWLRPGDRRELSRRARDFLDWMRPTVDVPGFVPAYAMAALRRALDEGSSVLWEGAPLRELIPEVAVLRPEVDTDVAIATMRSGPVVVRRARGVDEVAHFQAMHVAAGCRFGIIWDEPDVLPPLATRIIAAPLDWEVASAWLAAAGVDEPRIEAARLHLDPMAVSRRAGREPPPLIASSPQSLVSAAVDHVAAGLGGLRTYFPSEVVTLTTELDSQNQLVVRHQGVPLSFHGDALEIIEEPSSLPVKLEILDFTAGRKVWKITAHHGNQSWERGRDRCSFLWGETAGKVRVDIVATASGGASQGSRFYLEVASIVAKPPAA